MAIFFHGNLGKLWLSSFCVFFLIYVAPQTFAQLVATMSGLLVACVMVKSCKLLSKNSNFKFVFEVAAHIALDLDGHFSDHFYAAVATFGGRSGKEKFKVCCRSQFYIYLIIISNSLGYQKWKGHLATKVDSKLKYYNLHWHFQSDHLILWLTPN